MWWHPRVRAQPHVQGVSPRAAHRIFSSADFFRPGGVEPGKVARGLTVTGNKHITVRPFQLGWNGSEADDRYEARDLLEHPEPVVLPALRKGIVAHPISDQ